MLHAVKGLVFKKDGSILLQHRDHTPGIPYPGFWSFFGGMMEAGESKEVALERELIEELGKLPGEIGEEIFDWLWYGEEVVKNHCLVVYCPEDPGPLELNEGQGMGWFQIPEIMAMNTTPGLADHIDIIQNYLIKFLKT